MGEVVFGLLIIHALQLMEDALLIMRALWHGVRLDAYLQHIFAY